MSRVEAIQRTLRELTSDEFAQVARYVHDLEQEHWDYQLDRDAAAGKLDFLLDEAQQDGQAGLLRDWPPVA